MTPWSCWLHRPEMRAGSLCRSAHVADSMPVRSCPLVACVARFGSFDSSPPVRKLSPQAVISAVAPISAHKIFLFIYSRYSGSAIQCDGHDERARLRVLEEVDALRQELRATEVRLGVQPLVLGPCMQVPSGDANERAAEAETRPHERVVERVDHRHLTPLHEAAVLDELRLHRARAAAEAGEPAFPLL